MQNILKNKLAYDGAGYALYHCIFHEPDRHPSLYLNKKKGYLHDFHDGQSYSLKTFLEKAGALPNGKGAYNSEKTEKDHEPMKFLVTRFADLISNAKEVSYITEPLLPLGALILLVGRPGEGKSFLSLDFCLKTAKGERLLDVFQVGKCNVLLIDLENSLNLLRERARFISDSIPENLFFYHGDFTLENKRCLEELEKTIEQNNVKLVVIDNLSSILKFTKEVDNIKVYQLMKKLRDISLKHGITITLIHHLRKVQPFTGNILDEVGGVHLL